MLTVGLTGNIGSGKTRVAKIFTSLGVPVYDADTNAKKFLNYPQVKKIIKNTFGENVISANHQVDRKALAQIVFNDKFKLKTLNSIIHPYVISDFKSWITNHTTNYELPTTNYVIIESAILFESGYNTIANQIITVTCPESIRIQRIIKRDRVSEQQVRYRINNQWTEGKKVKLSDYVIINDNTQPLIPQVIKIHKLLISNL